MVVTRRDGTKENLGIMAYYSKNPLKHYPVNAYIWVRDHVRRVINPSRFGRGASK